MLESLKRYPSANLQDAILQHLPGYDWDDVFRLVLVLPENPPTDTLYVEQGNNGRWKNPPAQGREQAKCQSDCCMQAPAFAPGTVITNRPRLWRVDAQEGNVLVATTMDSGQPEQQKFYIPFENIKPSRLALPSADRLGHIQTQELLLRAYRLSLLHGSALLLSLQGSRVIPKDYQLVPVMMALETPRGRMSQLAEE